MSRDWGALNARVRGLGSHLLGDERMRELERAASLPELREGLTNTPYDRVLRPSTAGAAELDAGVARSVADRIQVLGRWARQPSSPLSLACLETDADNVRAIVRGGVGGVAPHPKLSATVPTPGLDRRALETLARARSPAEVGALLTAWGHPLGPPLLSEARAKHPDPFRMELALVRAWTSAALRIAARLGGAMRGVVASTIDAMNAVTALVVAGGRSERVDEGLFLEGGIRIEVEAFMSAGRAETRVLAAEQLVRALRGQAIGDVVREAAPSPSAVATALAEQRLHDLTRMARYDPVGPLPVLVFLLRLRREARSLRSAIWRSAVMGGARS